MKFLASLGLALSLLGSTAHAEDLKIKFTLDWKIQGVHAAFYLAQEKGYFAAEGLDVTIDQGEGSAATVTRIMSGAYDAGFGDMNAIIQNAATNPEAAPVMVYQVYNQPPFSVLTKADGPIKALSDLEGAKVGAPAGSAATQLFPALAEAAGFDASKVDIINLAPNLQEQMLVQDQVDASLVFNVTSALNVAAMGLNPDTDFRWFNYGEYGLDIYSNGVMVSQKLAREHPEAVTGLVSAINKALAEVIANPQEGIDVIVATEPLSNPEVELRRLNFAIANLIESDETRANGVGAVDPARLERSIGVISDLYGLPTAPAAAAVFTDAFLPAQDARMF